jgi:hypothetical protein
LEQIGYLLLTKAAVCGPAGVRIVRLLVDGLLGMDFLRPSGAKILLAERAIELP